MSISTSTEVLLIAGGAAGVAYVMPNLWMPLLAPTGIPRATLAIAAPVAVGVGTYYLANWYLNKKQ